ncbi:helix-turn-helix domain-containing protein [Streptomyces sp. NPDC058701]|uniref:helix-turn-helix domain-containing protein n=1 Tax=Streptomyces sp. NPDC058701 TaxID=3346608 RepID=UPI00365DA9C5
MLITTTGLLGMLHQLELTPTAIKVLSVMFRHSESGGVVHMKQAEIDEVLGVGQASMSRAMALLVERGLVLRSNGGRGHRYALHPAVAGYSGEGEMKRELAELQAAGTLPPINVPDYTRRPPRPGSGRNLHAVA